MQTIYANRQDVPTILAKITRQQLAANLFRNVSVKSYHGHKYPAQVKITIG